MLLQVHGQAVGVATGGREPDSSLPTVVFVHGTGQDHSIWVLPTRYFARHGCNALAVDLPGHGRSGGEPLETVEAIADWLVAVLDAAALGQATLVGHSLGSQAVIAAAARHPERVRAGALVGTAFPMRVAPALLDAARENRPEAIAMLTAWGLSAPGRMGGNPTPGNWMLGAGRRLMERARPGVIHADLRACNDYAAGLEHAAATRCPMLLILGERDRLTPPRAATKLAAAFPDAHTEILPHCGHAIYAEQPDAMLDQLIGMVEKMGPE